MSEKVEEANPEKDQDQSTAIIKRLEVGKIANLFDLTLDVNRTGFQNVDYTAMVAEGSNVETVYVEVTWTVEGGSVVEVFAIPVGYIASARMTIPDGASDSADRQASIHVVDGKNLTKGGQQADGTPTQIFDSIDDYQFRLAIDLTVKLNLKTSDIFAEGSVSGAFVHKTTGAAPRSDSREAALSAAITVRLLSYGMNQFTF